jgi:hypothetical protein
LCTAPLLLCAAAIPSPAHAETDACTLLTAAQVGAAIGMPVTAGEHADVREDLRLEAVGPAAKAVTLFLQTAASYDGGKRPARWPPRAKAGRSSLPASATTPTTLLSEISPGSWSRRAAPPSNAVHATLTGEKKEAMELILAEEAAAKL